MTKTTQQILSLGGVKEAQVKAFFSYYYKLLGEDYEKDIQEKTTGYAYTLARSFIAKHKEFFDNNKNRIEFYNEMRIMGADKPHSGHRFWEQMYTAVSELEQTNER